MPGRLIFSTTADGASTTTERIRITSTGYVGINTTTPGERLEIDGNIKLQQNDAIIWNTNDKGYLDTDLILIADRFELLENEVEPILHKVQRLNPLGIGSRSLEECLMIQLEDEKGSLSHKIVNKYFDDFMHKRYEKIQE